MVRSDNLHVGFDIGSSSVNYSVLGSNGGVVFSPAPILHFASPLDALKKAWIDVIDKFGEKNIRNTAFTGSGSKIFSEAMRNITHDYDSIAIPKGARVIDSGVEYVFHIGAKDAYFFNLAESNGESVIREVRPGSKCGGGSGTLLEKQCRRLLGQRISCLRDTFKMAENMARESYNPSKFLARCGIVIQSDLIHKQNEGVSKQDNLAGLFEATARNYIVDVLGNRKLSNAKAIATGGVMSNLLVKDTLEDLLGIKICRPGGFNFENIGAIGVAAKGLEEGNDYVFSIEELDFALEKSRGSRRFVSGFDFDNVNERSESLEDKISKGTEAILGIDGGSTTTKGALVELKTGRLLDKLYISTHGDPEGSLKDVLGYFSRHKDDVIIKGVATTGSARQLYQRILVNQASVEEMKKRGVKSVDKVIDEITCHALGVKHCDNNVDTIYEIGGQDMKYTEFNKDGTVKEAKMNFSCQAGGGQTLENMASLIGLDVKGSLQEEALKAEKIPVIDSTCGVFMEMDLNRLIAEGFSKSELAAAIVYGTASSYYHKFVGGSNGSSKNSSAQGGPALGNAFLAALAKASGDKINAFPHREMFGAWGAALDVVNKIKKLEDEGIQYDTAFRGWETKDMEFSKREIGCGELAREEGKKKCSVRDCKLEVYSIGSDDIVTGGFCPVGNSEVINKPKVNYVDKFHKILDKHFERYGVLFDNVGNGDRNVIGIRRSTATIGEKGIWSAALLDSLGFTPVITPVSNHDIAQIGISNSGTDFCIARKLATGHASIISRHSEIDYMFNPSFTKQVRDNMKAMRYCPYTAAESFIIKDDLSLDGGRLINPIIEVGDQDSLVERFYYELNRIGKKRSKWDIRQGLKRADLAESEFNSDICNTGDKFLKKIGNEVAYVGIGRDYVLLDPEASSDSGRMFAQTRGLNYIPQTFLQHKFKDVRINDIAPNEYWHESESIIKAQLYVSGNKGLYPVRLVNFGCGPDSMKIYQENRIQEDRGKPMLTLLTDGQTNNAPFVTRTEAHERVVNGHYRGGR